MHKKLIIRFSNMRTDQPSLWKTVLSCMRTPQSSELLMLWALSNMWLREGEGGREGGRGGGGGGEGKDGEGGGRGG